jgi:hypothetical protein
MAAVIGAVLVIELNKYTILGQLASTFVEAEALHALLPKPPSALTVI